MTRNEQLAAQAEALEAEMTTEGAVKCPACGQAMSRRLNERHYECACGSRLEANFSARKGLDGNEAGFIDPGQISHRGGNFIKAFHFFNFLKKEGNEAGGSSWLIIRLSRNLIKAALFFNQAAAVLTMYVKTALHAACTTRWVQSGRVMVISPRAVSKGALLLLLPVLLTSCETTFEGKPVVNTVEELASLSPIVACVYLLKWPLMIAAMGIAAHGLVLVKRDGDITTHKHSTADEEEEA